MSAKNPPVKLYYRIGEVSQVVGVQPHVLRYWESEFGAIRPKKSARGQRVYSHKDLEKLLRVKELLHTEGFTIAGARKKLAMPATEAPSLAQRQQAERVHSELSAIREQIRAELDSFRPGK